MDDYFKDVKKRLETEIPDFGSSDFEKLGNRIRNDLKRKETEYLIIIRGLKILVLGDWYKEKEKSYMI